MKVSDGFYPRPSLEAVRRVMPLDSMPSHDLDGTVSRSDDVSGSYLWYGKLLFQKTETCRLCESNPVEAVKELTIASVGTGAL